MNTRKVIVLDTTVLLNLGNIDRFSLLPRMADIDFVYLDEALREIVHGDAVPRFEAACREGLIAEATLSDVAGLALFAQLRRQVGLGEAQALAYAHSSGAILATDDKRRPFPMLAAQHLPAGRIVGTIDLYLCLIERGLVSVQEADADKAALAQRRFAMKHATFAGMAPRVIL